MTLQKDTEMKLIICILMLAIVGCTTFNYTGPDGKTISYSSSKDIKATVIKKGNDFTITIEADNQAKEAFSGIAEGIVKGLKK